MNGRKGSSKQKLEDAPLVESIESRFKSEVNMVKATGKVRAIPSHLVDVRLTDSATLAHQKEFKRAKSKEISDRLAKGWRDIDYVRKTSVDKDKYQKPIGMAAARPSQASFPVKLNDSMNKKYAQIQQRSVDRVQANPPRVTDPHAPLPNLVDLVKMEVEEESTEPTIYDRGLSFLDKREDKLSVIKKKIGPSFKPAVHVSSVTPRMTEPWQHYSSFEHTSAKRNPMDSKKQSQMQEQYEQHIAEKVAEGKAGTDRPRLNTVASVSTIADRNAEWKKKREDRLEQIRRGKADVELEPCTFKPKINKGFIAWN